MTQIASDFWSPADIIGSLKTLANLQLASVSILDSCSSTNDYLLSRKHPPKDKFNLCVAREQSAGRGRHGKTWHSNHCGIYLSLSWQTSASTANLGWLLLMTALRLAEGLQTFGISDIGIKWPNDLYYKNAKLAGILFEQSDQLAVMGLGLNIATPVGNTGNSKTNWVGLDKTAITIPTYSELFALATQAVLATCEPLGFDEGRRRFSKYDVLYNCSVEVDQKGKKLFGVARGIDAKARLLVDSNGQIDAYKYGEVSVRNDRITNRCRQ